MVAKLLTPITLFTLFLGLLAVASSQKPPISKLNCQSQCGDVKIPYPFGIGAGCYINDDWFQIICDNSSSSPNPFLSRTKQEVLEISVEDRNTLKVTTPIAFSNCSNMPINRQTANLEGSPFAYSIDNVFTVVGCDVTANITSNSDGYSISSGCKSDCNVSINKSNGTGHNVCNGVDCCQIAIPSFLSAFNTSFQPDDNQRRSSCNSAFLVDREWFQWYANNSTNISAISERDNIPVVLEWNLFHSTADVFGTFMEVNATTVSSDTPRPYCQSYNDTVFRLECTCGGGYCWN
ncbi:hypothetical protein PS1_024778 [Malus domestica]